MKTWIWPAATAVLALALVGVLYRFLVVGETVAASDGRQAIVLTAPERDLVLGEMRGFLEGVQTITLAMTEKDMARVAVAARKLGMGTAQAVPASLMRKLPLGFKQMGMSVHRAFDQIAVDAESMGDPALTQRQLAETLSTCVACHAAHRFELSPQ